MTEMGRKPDTEMVERIARVIFEHWFCGDWPPDHEMAFAMGAEDFRSCASEVIAAMSEPTYVMLIAGAKVPVALGYEFVDVDEPTAEEFWRVMIAAALAD